jgi:cyanuric acid amidohydrolase
VPLTRIHRIAAAAPDDMSGIEQAISAGSIDPAGIIAVFGKTEGNGLVNDFSRGFAVQSLRLLLEKHLTADEAASVCSVMSGGTEGGLAPHWLVLERADAPDGYGPALAIGRAHTADLLPEHLGRPEQVDMVTSGVADAMRDAGISDPADVHFVQIKCPLLTAQRISDAESRGQTVALRDTLKSMGASRGASALGVGVALGEIDRARIMQDRIVNDPSLWSGRASTSSGIELLNHEIVVLGMSDAWSGPLAIDHAVMATGIDIEPVRAALSRLGLDAEGQLSPSQRTRLVALLAKAEASRSGMVGEKRHTMNDDSDISSTRHARGFVAGALGGLVGHTEIFVSGGAEHQGPDGGGPVAVIVEKPQEKDHE